MFAKYQNIVKWITEKSNIYKIFLIVLFLTPDYFALSISDVLPVLSLKRVFMVICFFVYIYSFFKQKDEIKIRIKEIISNPYSKFFCAIFLISVFGICINFSIDSLKGLMWMLVEQCALFFLFIDIMTTVSIHNTLEIVKRCLMCLLVLGILEAVFNYNFFSLIATTDRVEQLPTVYYRMGNLRIESIFFHPLEYCLVLELLFVFYLRKNDKEISYKNIWIIMSAINVLLTYSRSAILCVGLQLVIIFFFLPSKQKKQITKILFAVSIVVLVLIIVAPNSGISMMVKDNVSMMSATLFGEEIENFGGNENAFGYRKHLFSLFKSEAINPIVGNGINYARNNLVPHVLSGVTFYEFDSIDNFYVLRYIELGYLGLISYVVMFVATLIYMMKDYLRTKDKTYIIFFSSCLGYMVMLFMVDAMNSTKYFWFVIALYYVYRREKGLENILLNEK